MISHYFASRRSQLSAAFTPPRHAATLLYFRLLITLFTAGYH